ncbi:unnamed protein product [Pocillopora meandrina]|uniref:Uncharacterized protein n=1 Tax=Pocillopora meandrina TaxID=46732 RepID=A0AAU9W896_9CNID|nr:unnamed protein product [Pocillopora meandrina]
MNMKFEMKGNVNRHYFEVEGEGKGRLYEGLQKSTFWVTKGGPLPFSFDPLSTVFKYGNRCFTKYPAGMPDYFKQVFPAGISFERTVIYEDGGVATASGHFSSNVGISFLLSIWISSSVIFSFAQNNGAVTLSPNHVVEQCEN